MSPLVISFFFFLRESHSLCFTQPRKWLHDYIVHQGCLYSLFMLFSSLISIRYCFSVITVLPCTNNRWLSLNHHYATSIRLQPHSWRNLRRAGRPAGAWPLLTPKEPLYTPDPSQGRHTTISLPAHLQRVPRSTLAYPRQHWRCLRLAACSAAYLNEC